jgi:hypothetical protein
MRVFWIVLISVVTVCVGGVCHAKKAYEPVVVEASTYPYGKFVLCVLHHEHSYGNKEQISEFLTRTDRDEADLFFTNSHHGRVDGADLSYKLFGGDNMTRPIRGYVDFGENSVTIALEMPVYNNGSPTTRWRKYDFNGTHRLKLDLDLSSKKPLECSGLPKNSAAQP